MERSEVLDRCFQDLQLSLDKLSHHRLDDLCEQLQPLESAKLKVSLAYSLASLQFIQLRLQSKDTRHHPIHDDLGRIKELIQTIKELEQQRKKPVIDEAAAARMIQFELNKNISDLSSGGPATKRQKR